MRIGVSGAHGTGKTTLVEELCNRLPDHTPVDEPYVLFEEEGHEFEYPPSVDDYRLQLRRSLVMLRTAAPGAVFDRTPLDFLAYLTVCGVDAESEADADELRAAMSLLDLLIVVPVTAETGRQLPAVEMPELQRAVDSALMDLVHADPLDVCGHLRVVELTGPLTTRIESVVTAL
ncbi:ATP-binding protein [Rhodococcus hoagii]|nr:ATP-binding protein [Prescottella equi]